MRPYSLNPYTREYEYIPDGEPHVFGDRVYIYGSHDKFDGKAFCMNDYICYSADVEDLADWRYEGVIYPRTADPRMKDGTRYLWAPDVAKGPDGRYYLYYCPDGDLEAIGVAVCDTPAGEYRYYGLVQDREGRPIGKRPGDTVQFDPGVFVDDDGKIYLFSGNGPRVKRDIGKLNKASVVMELCEDMKTIRTEPRKVLPTLGTADGSCRDEDFSGTDLRSFKGHEFFEASSIRKYEGLYYLVYSSVALHQLCWAVSGRPDGGYRYGGVLVSNADIFEESGDLRLRNAWGNDHGGIEKIGDRYYIFYHRHTQRSNFSRQGAAERIERTPDGRFLQAELTSGGLTGDLPGEGTFPASCACHIHRNFKQAVSHHLAMRRRYPWLTQEGPDIDAGAVEAGAAAPRQYITNCRRGACILFRYFDLSETRELTVRLRGKARGRLSVLNGENGEKLGELTLAPSADWREERTALTGGKAHDGICLYFEGSGSFDLLEFVLSR